MKEIGKEEVLNFECILCPIKGGTMKKKIYLMIPIFIMIFLNKKLLFLLINMTISNGLRYIYHVLYGILKKEIKILIELNLLNIVKNVIFQKTILWTSFRV